MQRRPKLRARMLVLGVVATAFVGVGCASREDRAFALEVVPVLAQAVQLESTMTIPLPTSDGATWNIVRSDGQRALADVKGYRIGVRKLAHPERRELRYLRLKLERIGETAEGLVNASIGSRASMMPGDVPPMTMMMWVAIVHSAAETEGMWRAEFMDALRGAAAAERIAIKSSALTVRHVPRPIQSESYTPRPEMWSDSLLTAVERLERAEISAEGR